MRNYADPLRKILRFLKSVPYDAGMKLWNICTVLWKFPWERQVFLKTTFWKIDSGFTTLKEFESVWKRFQEFQKRLKGFESVSNRLRGFEKLLKTFESVGKRLKTF